MSIGEVLGHDIDGRPLLAGDEVVVVGLKRDAQFNGHRFTISGEYYREKGWICVAEDEDSLLLPINLRKLDNHQPAGSFEEVMAGLRKGVEA